MLNEALRLVRAYHDISQTQLCVALGVSNSHLSEIESGKKTPSLDLLQKYSSHFDIPISSLIFFSENLDKAKVTDRLRIGAAKKIISILQWNEQRNSKLSPATGNK
jgi:transcriptional regulator with XRE-family HTH domain